MYIAVGEDSTNSSTCNFTTAERLGRNSLVSMVRNFVEAHGLDRKLIFKLDFWAS